MIKLGVTRIKLKFGGKYYKFHISHSTEVLAKREVKNLREKKISAQYVTRKDYFHPHNIVYKVYKRKRKRRKKN